MIRQLQRKFIVIAMISIAVVLLAVMFVVNFINYQNIVRESDQMLELIGCNRGVFPQAPIPMEIDWDRFPSWFQSPEAPFENRYFSVLMDEEGDVILVNTEQIMAINGEDAVSYAKVAIESGKECGSQGDYRFRVNQLEDGNTLVVFLDCGRALNRWISFLRTSGILYILALAVVFLMIAFASRRAVRPIYESYEKQKQFITDAGHEIKTPLTIIAADAEVLALETPGNEWVQDIKAQTQRLSELTTDLINLSRMEETQNGRSMIDVPFSDIVSEAVQSFAGPIKTQGLMLESMFQPMLTVCGDEKALRQLISILMDNAVKYSVPEGTIAVTLARSGRNALLRVSNGCQPLSQEQLSHLFDRFYRTDNVRTTGKGGYGIGLSIAQATVQAHKGKILAQSKDGRTLTVSVTLPLSRLNPAEEKEIG